MLETIEPSSSGIKPPSTHGKDVTQTYVQPVAVAKDPQTIDAFMRLRAVQNPINPILSYPIKDVEYVDYTMQQLDVFAYRVAKAYNEILPMRSSSEEKPAVVGLLGPSDLDYVVTMLALTKMGHTVLFLSTQISTEAYLSLVNTTGAQHLIVHPRFAASAEAIAALKPDINILPFAGRAIYDMKVESYGDTSLDRHLDPSVEKDNICFIIHSSGSTGLPKPIYQTHLSALKNYAGNMNMKGFITLPLFHNHGICNFFRTVHCMKSLHMYNADLPLASRHLLKVMRENKFEIFYGVPYALKLLAESEEGIRILRDLKIVMYGGSACPDSLGNTLVENDVNLVGHYGATEVGQLMTSFRPDGDKAWDYVRVGPIVRPFISFEPRGSGMFECCVKEGWPSKVQTNRPDGSYATKDLFVPHPTIPDAWKYIARLDDTLVLINGEKAQPVAPEGDIRSNPHVAEAVIFGAGRPTLGLMIVPAASTVGVTPESFLDLIWPTVEKANKTMETYAQISKDMIIVLPHDAQYPRTDKGTVIRQAFYKQFAKEIDDSYAFRPGQELLVMNELELRAFLRAELTEIAAHWEHVDDDADLFSHGLDSLQATRLRNTVLKKVDIGGRALGNNIAFDHPTIALLAAHLHALRTGSEAEREKTVEAEMQGLIEKYSDFRPHTLVSYYSEGRSVVLTGATGSLGAHIVAQLASQPDITRVYCLIRAKSPIAAERRVISSLRLRRVYHTMSLEARRKICAMSSDLSLPDLGLGEAMYSQLAGEVRAVIHCAWAVNFNLNLRSFENDCIAGVRNLINLALSARGPRPASFDFCSSISTIVRSTIRPVPECLPKDLASAQSMGYAQSKLVAEHLCARAAQQTGLPCRVLRIGQIIGDTAHGIWNATEGVPLMLQTAKTIGALPQLVDQLLWLPVDSVAASVVEIATSDAGSIFTNITNPRALSWTDALLPALKASGLDFEELEPKKWIQRLRNSNADPVANPPIKLLDFFASKYDRGEFAPSITFETDVAQTFSPTLARAEAPDQTLIRKFTSYFERECWASNANLMESKRKVLVFTGQNGQSKSSLPSTIASKWSCPVIEAGSTPKIEDGATLTNSISSASIASLRDQIKEVDPQASRVLVVCSSLTRANRDMLRELIEGVSVVFVDLQAKQTTEELSEEKEGPEIICVDETDVVPVDADWPLQRLLGEVEALAAE